MEGYGEGNARIWTQKGVLCDDFSLDSDCLASHIIGSFGLIFQVSSLFSNVISALALPIVPILAVIFFNDKMNGVKVVAILLAV